MSKQRTEAVEREIAQEKAEALGLAGKMLETALAELRAHDANACAKSDPTGAAREKLLANAAYRLQNVVIQRESQGLRDPHFVFKFYSVPREIVARMGARPR